MAYLLFVTRCESIIFLYYLIHLLFIMDNIADTRPLIVVENEIQDNAEKIARLDPDVMGQMNVLDGDLIEVISQ